MRPKLRPIFDCTCSLYKYIGKFLSDLLFPLTCNDYSLKDTFEAAERIKSIPKQLFEDGYKFVSFDVVSLFTKVTLRYTTKLILNKVYEEKVSSTTLHKRTLKK